MHEKLWPGRDAALYVYCPRIFHRVMVEGWDPGLPLLDRMGLLPVQQPLCIPRRSRGLQLSSQTLGIADTVEQVELPDGRSVPVLLRSNAGRRFRSADGRLRAPEVHPHDAFRLAMQAILLEEAGQANSHGLAYYAADDIALELPLDSLLRVQSLELLEKARACAGGPPPAHDCDGCRDL